MRMAIIGFAAGAACLQTQASLPAIWLIASAGGVLPLWLILLRRLPAAWRAWSALVAGGLAGFCWAAWLAHCALAPQLAAADEGRDFTVVGTIDNLPYRFAQGVRFNFEVERVPGAGRSAIAYRGVVVFRLSRSGHRGGRRAAGRALAADCAPAAASR